MINGMPTPPTDNLYKFLAISGIVCLLAAKILSVQVMISTHDKVDQALETFVEDGSAKGFKIIEEFRLDFPDKADHEKMIKLRNEALQRTHDVDLEYYNDRVSEIRSDEAKAQTGLNILATVGSILACFGFVAWAIKVQRFQDGILRLEFESDRRTFEKDHPGEYEKITSTWLKRQWTWMKQRIGRK